MADNGSAQGSWMELRGAEVLGGGRLPGRDITLQETERRKRLSSEGLFLVPLQKPALLLTFSHCWPAFLTAPGQEKEGIGSAGNQDHRCSGGAAWRLAR